jgi:hypothetical protein
MRVTKTILPPMTPMDTDSASVSIGVIGGEQFPRMA